MPKRKMTSGVLARDRKNNDSTIVFFARLRRDQVEQFHGFWTVATAVDNIEAREFTEDEWKYIYDMKPPRRGTAFEVEIEL